MLYQPKMWIFWPDFWVDCWKATQGPTLTLQPLLFWISMPFPFSDFPCFLVCFAFFPRILWLSGMFRCSASLAIPHRKSFAAIPSVSLVHLGTRIAMFRCHTNRSVELPSFRQTDSLLPTRRHRGRTLTLKQGLCLWRFAGRSHRTIRFRIWTATASHGTMPLRGYPKRKTIVFLVGFPSFSKKNTSRLFWGYV